MTIDNPRVLAQGRENTPVWVETSFERRWRLASAEDIRDERDAVDELVRERGQRKAANKLVNAADYLRQTQVSHERARVLFMAAVRAAVVAEHDVEVVAELSGLTADEVREVLGAVEGAD